MNRSHRPRHPNREDRPSESWARQGRIFGRFSLLVVLALFAQPAGAFADEIAPRAESPPGIAIPGEEDALETQTPVPTATPRPSIQVRGEVVEMACYLIGGRRGETHKQCAIACARAGESLGILDEKSGLLYLGAVDHRQEGATDPLLPYIAQRVDARGFPLEYGDLPALIVEEIVPLTSSR